MVHPEIDERRLEKALESLADDSPGISQDELSRLARKATSSNRLSRAPRPRRALLFAAALLALLALVPAVELGGNLRDRFSPTASAQASVGVWSWDTVLPGRPVLVDRPLRDSVRDSGVVPGRALEVVAVRYRGGRLALIAAPGPAGRVCFAPKWTRSLGSFRCFDRFAAEAVIEFAYSESRADPSDRALVGIARSDVARVTLALSDGSEHRVPLNRWRGFAYATRSEDQSFTRLTAHGRDGVLLARVEYGVSLRSAVCSGSSDGCAAPLT